MGDNALTTPQRAVLTAVILAILAVPATILILAIFAHGAARQPPPPTPTPIVVINA